MANTEGPLRKELQQLLNKEGIDNLLNTPDYILAQYLMDCLVAFQRAREESSKDSPTPEKVKCGCRELIKVY